MKKIIKILFYIEVNDNINYFTKYIYLNYLKK